MTYRLEKNGDDTDIVIDGWQKGIASSPHNGIANMQAVNINTELNEVMCSYARTQQSQTAISTGVGALSRGGTNVLLVNVGITGSDIQAGSWIVVTNSTLTGLSNGTYYVISKNGGQFGQIQISTTYSTSSSSIVTGFSGSGTADVVTTFNMGLPIQGATERYVNTSGVTQYRYYVMDSFGFVWVHDTATYSGVDTPNWALPYTGSLSSLNGSVTTTACGLAVYNGWLFLFGGNRIFTVSTSQLGATPIAFPSTTAGSLMSPAATTNLHYALSGGQGRLYYTDGRFVGSIFADTSIATTAVISNVQSYCSYTASGTTGTVTGILNGSLPTENPSVAPNRIPAFFFPAFGGTKPAAITLGTKYYIKYLPAAYGTFEVYAAPTGGAAINLATGAVGTQYFNTFFPQSADGDTALVFSPQRVTLPANEIGTCLAELGNTIVIGTESNIIYPWNQIDPIPSDILPMPESYTSSMVTVNNVIYIFAGYKGNIYITNASSVSLALSVPDYCSGIIEPYFVWGGAMFLRGRVYFSIQDQTSTHTGQCGGVWSFIPAQNFSYEQEIGLALRMDNKNSYNTFNGRATVLIPSRDQQARSPQYWSAWISSTTSPTYGIDFTRNVPSTPAVVQSDIIPTGTLLNKKTFKQIEYKLAAPLVDTETVALAYRTDLSSAFASAGTVQVESSTALSGYLPVNFEKSQWVQLQATLTPTASTSNGEPISSFVRLVELRIR